MREDTPGAIQVGKIALNDPRSYTVY